MRCIQLREGKSSVGTGPGNLQYDHCNDCDKMYVPVTLASCDRRLVMR